MEPPSRLETLEAERDRLREEVVRLRREGESFEHLQLLFETAAELFHAEDLEPFVQKVFGRLAARLELDGCLHYRSGAGGGELELTACIGLDEETRRKIRRLDLEQITCGADLNSGLPTVIEDLQASPQPESAPLRALGLSGYACFPLAGPSGLHGTFSFFRRGGSRFTEAELELLHFVSDLVGVAWERKSAERELRESEARYRELADDSPDSILVTVRDRVVYANRAAALLLGVAHESEVVGRPIFDLIEPEFHDLVRGRIARQVLRRSGNPRVECRWSRTDGPPVDVEVSASRVAWHGRVAIQSVVRDIGDRKRVERELEEARRTAERTSAAKSQFLAMMSHELRTPLAGAFGFVRLLDAEVLGPVTEEQKEALTRLAGGLSHLAGIIEEILTFSRAEAGREEARWTEADLAEVARELVANAEPRARSRGLSLRLEVAGSALARTDAGRVRQILLNLVDNALKYTPAGKVVVEVDGSAADHVALRVRDSGPGIAPEDQETIFEPFTQIDSAYTREASGTGLGLAICRRLAELIRAELTVSSALERGSTFTLWVPRRQPPPGKPSQEAEPNG